MNSDGYLEQAVCVSHDEGSEAVAKLFQEIWPGTPRVQQHWSSPISHIDLETAMLAFKDTAQITGRALVTYGHGNRHHYTYGLCKALADAHSQGYSYLHFDKHADYGFSERLSCGEFVHAILQHTYAKNNPYLLIGCSRNQEDIGARKVNEAEAKAHFKNVLARMPRDFYLTFDLDVMAPDEIITGYGQGYMTLSSLLDYVSLIQAEKRIIGADILGSSASHDQRGHHLYAILAGVLLGRDVEELKKERQKL